MQRGPSSGELIVAKQDALTSPTGWADDWSVALRVWVERSGVRFLDPERLDLLRGIDSCHSISAAARQLGISYRHAWDLVHAMNSCSETPIVISVTGGLHGGGAELTPFARGAIDLFARIRDHLHQQASQLLNRMLAVDPSRSLHVAAAVSLEDVLNQLLTQYSLEQPKIRVRAIYGGSDELADQILGGAPIDLFLSADHHQIDRIVAAGLIDSTAPRVVARNGLALITGKESGLTIRRLKELSPNKVKRLAIASNSCPLGRYSRALLREHRLLDAMEERMVNVDHSGAVVSSVRAGQADVGLIYTSDIQRAADCDVLFRVEKLPEPIVYSVAAVRRDRGTDADRLLNFLLEPESRRRWRACGFLSPAISRSR